MKSNMRNTRSDIVFNVIIYVLFSVILLIVAYPLWFILVSSFSDPSAVSSGKVWFWPSGFTLQGYTEIFKRSEIWIAYRNTIAYTFVGTFVSLAVNIPAAYALSRRDLAGRKILTLFFIFTMFFNGGLIPTYFTVKQLGLLNTFTVMVLPFSVTVYYIIVARTFFSSSLPDDLLNAAQIDGCGNIRFFFTMALPLSKAVIAVIALWTAVAQWNSYFNALIYLPNAPNLQPLQLLLRSILIVNQTATQWGQDAVAQQAQKTASLLKYSTIIVSSLPIMLLYPFSQKYFNQGVMVGAIKE